MYIAGLVHMDLSAPVHVCTSGCACMSLMYMDVDMDVCIWVFLDNTSGTGFTDHTLLQMFESYNERSFPVFRNEQNRFSIHLKGRRNK